MKGSIFFRMITILNGNSFGWVGLSGKPWYEPGRQLVYCGRSHKGKSLQQSLLCNPYPMQWDTVNNRYVPGERKRVHRLFQLRYRTELLTWRETKKLTLLVEGTILVARLYLKIGKVDLVCHCMPQECHCEFVKLAIPWTIRTLTVKF